MSTNVTIVGAAFPSFYLKDYQEAIEFYTKVLGPPENVDVEGGIHGWRLGNTWLTLFPSSIGSNPDTNVANGEFAIQVAAKDDVDRLYQRFLDNGAKTCMPPEDTEMYDPMRFSCVDDPFGIRVDIYAPL